MKRFNIVALAAFIGLLVWVFLFDTPTTRNIQAKVMSIFSPFNKAGAKAQEAVTGVGTDRRSAAELKAENETLRRDYQEAVLFRAEYERLKKQVAQYEKDLGFKAQNPFLLRYAKIMVRKTSAWYRGAILDKGARDGIQMDSPVIVPEGLVGRVVKVGDNESEILFLTDELCRVAAEVEGSPLRGIVEGVRVSIQSKPQLRLRHLPRGIEIPQGRLIYTSALSSSFPAGIVVGRVDMVRETDNSSEAILKPAVDFDNLTNVFVMALSSPAAEHAPAPPAPAPSR